VPVYLVGCWLTVYCAGSIARRGRSCDRRGTWGGTCTRYQYGVYHYSVMITPPAANAVRRSLIPRSQSISAGRFLCCAEWHRLEMEVLQLRVMRVQLVGERARLGRTDSEGSKHQASENRLSRRGVSGEGRAAVASHDRQRPWRRLARPAPTARIVGTQLGLSGRAWAAPAFV
jgi:hypothetical protein